MKTEEIWADLKTKATLYSLSPGQLTALTALEEIAISACPESDEGVASLEKDQDGDVVILLFEATEGAITSNGAWAKVVIESDGWVQLTGSSLKFPLTHWFPAVTE